MNGAVKPTYNCSSVRVLQAYNIAKENEKVNKIVEKDRKTLLFSWSTRQVQEL